MVANNVPLGGDAAGDCRFLADVAADEKEGRLHPVLGKNIQEMPGMRIVGPVIESERELAWVWPAGYGGAKNLRLRRHAVIGRGGAQTCGEAGGAQQEKMRPKDHCDDCTSRCWRARARRY